MSKTNTGTKIITDQEWTNANDESKKRKRSGQSMTYTSESENASSGIGVRLKPSIGVGGGDMGGKAKALSMEDSIYMGLVEVVEEIVGPLSISALCKELDVKQKNKKSGEEEYNTFCLDYFYHKMVKENLLEAVRDMLHDKLGKKKTKASLFEISSATLLNYKVDISVDEEELERLIAWCRSEKQLRFWKLLFFKYLQKVNERLVSIGNYRGSFSYSPGFFKLLESLYVKTHDAAYIGFTRESCPVTSSLEEGEV